MPETTQREKPSLATSYWPLVTCLSLVVLSGLVHGAWSDRWRTSAEPAACAARVECVPLELGEWRAGDREVDPKEQQIAELSGALLRRYAHRGSQGEVTVAIASGRAGPVSVHTPDICFRGAGQEMMGTPLKYALP